MRQGVSKQENCHSHYDPILSCEIIIGRRLQNQDAAYAAMIRQADAEHKLHTLYKARHGSHVNTRLVF